MSSNDKQKKKKKKRECNFAYDVVRVTGARPVMLWLRIKTVHVGEKSPKRVKGGVLIAANHIGFLDPVIVHCSFWYRRLNCLATKDLYKNKLLTKFFNAMHCIMVDKENFHMGTFRSACDRLKEDKAVLIFPEGSINKDAEKVATYKAGAIVMAHMSKKPILPVYIARAKKWYQRSQVLIGEPIDVTSMCGMIPTMEEIEKASAYLHEKEIELMEYYNRSKEKKDE